jgi:YkoY family integral membrane protein
MEWLQYFHLHDIQAADFLVVGVLIVLEGLLSCDNAVVLALLVKHLPPEQRGRALRYGIIGAYVFRILALMLAVWIMSQWYLKVFGGLYLVWMGASFFFKKKEEHGSDGGGGEGTGSAKPARLWFGLSAFWSTVIAVELTDIVFSVDSIAAAVALTDKLWVLILGALAGILVMRFAAQGFVTLLEKFPRLEACAFAAVLFIGLKLLCELPGDVVGQQHAFPAGTTYATAKEYHQAVETHCPPVWQANHVATINSGAAPKPEAYHFIADRDAIARIEALPAAERTKEIAAIEHVLASAASSGQEPPKTVQAAGATVALPPHAHREFQKARSDWNLHLRPLVEAEGWTSSLVVLIIFAFGFMRGRKPSPT